MVAPLEVMEEAPRLEIIGTDVSDVADVVKVKSPEVARLPEASFDLTR